MTVAGFFVVAAESLLGVERWGPGACAGGSCVMPMLVQATPTEVPFETTMFLPKTLRISSATERRKGWIGW